MEIKDIAPRQAMVPMMDLADALDHDPHDDHAIPIELPGGRVAGAWHIGSYASPGET